MIFWPFLLSLTLGTADIAPLFQQELQLINRQQETTTQTVRQEEQEHNQRMQSYRQELAQLTEKLQQANNELANQESAWRLLQEKLLQSNDDQLMTDDADKLAIEWQQLAAQRLVTKTGGTYFDEKGQQQSGEIYQLGEIAAIALDPQPQPLQKTAGVWQIVKGSTTANKHILPVKISTAGSKKKRTFSQYMAAGGILSWPITVLGVAVLLIIMERAIFFFRHRHTAVLTGKQRFRFKRSLTLIATASPLLGLLGTVLGIMDAFDILAIAGQQPNPAALSGAISEALITTELGLIVALSALGAHHLLTIWGQSHDEA